MSFGNPPETDLERQVVERLSSLPSDKSLEPIAAFRRWCGALRAIPAGDFCLRSLAAEVYLSHDEKISLLLHATKFYILEERSDKADAPLRALARACYRFPDHGGVIGRPVGELARFIDLGSAVQFLLPLDHPDAVNFSESELLWRDRLSVPGILRDPLLLRSLHGRIRGGEDVNVFSTRAQWVEEQGLSEPTLAERVRDRLGLPHLAKKHVLEIRIPENAAGKLRKPTFADAGGYPPFLPSRREDAYGTARDLAADTLDTRGGPEVWHEPLKASEASGLRYLAGPTSDLRAGIWKEYNDFRSRS